MPEEAKAAPCVACDRTVLPGLDVCLACGGRPLYQSLKEGEYAVEAGPIASQKFRDATVALLDRLLERPLTPDRIQRLADERVRVCQNLEKPVAEALAHRLGRQETSAAVVAGAAPERGTTGGFAKPWPWLSLVVGLALAVLLAWWWAILGVGLAVGLAYSWRRERMGVVGDAIFPPTAWAAWNPIARRAADLLGALDGQAKTDLAAVTGGVHEVLARLDGDDGLGIAARGMDGNLGKAMVELLEQAVAAGEGFRASKDPAAAQALARFADAARKAQQQVAALGKSLEPAPRLTAQVDHEVEQLSQRVKELKRVWTH